MAVPGLAAMLIGGFLMLRTPGGAFLNVSAGFIFGVTLVTGVLTFAVLRMIYKAVRQKPASGMDGMIGCRAVIVGKSGDVDMAMIHGEYWRVSCDETYRDLSEGDEVEVLEVSSMTLRVKPVKSESK